MQNHQQSYSRKLEIYVLSRLTQTAQTRSHVVEKNVIKNTSAQNGPKYNEGNYEQVTLKVCVKNVMSAVTPHEIPQHTHAMGRDVNSSGALPSSLVRVCGSTKGIGSEASCVVRNAVTQEKNRKQTQVHNIYIYIHIFIYVYA